MRADSRSRFASFERETGLSRQLVVPCLAGLAGIAVFAVLDALLEAYAVTAQQMLIRLVVVATALGLALVIVVSLAQRLRACQEQMRLVQEQAERWRAAAQQEAWQHDAARLHAMLMSSHANASAPEPPVDLTSPPQTNTTEHRRRPSGSTALSPREREIASLVTCGRTNRQIAVALVISERTVETHLERIYAKLDLHSRSQLALWLTQHHSTDSTGGISRRS